MGLRTQLLLVSIFALALPWAGCEYVREMETVLRQSQVQSLAASAQTVTRLFENQNIPLYRSEAFLSVERNVSTEIAATQLSHKINLDGYLDDWPVPYRFFHFGDPKKSNRTEVDINFTAQANHKVNLMAAVDNDYAYFYFRVFDPVVVYRSAAKVSKSSQPNYDQVQLWLDDGQVSINTEAPGSLSILAVDEKAKHSKVHRRISGQWQDTIDGYNLEFKIPLTAIGDRFGFRLVDVGVEDQSVFTLGNVTTVQGVSVTGGIKGVTADNVNAPLFIYPNKIISSLLKELSSNNIRFQIVDNQGWVIADSGEPLAKLLDDAEQKPYLLRLLYRSILFDSSSSNELSLDRQRVDDNLLESVRNQGLGSHWYGGIDAAHLLVALPINSAGFPVGNIVAIHNTAPILSLTDTAINKLLLTSFIAVFLAATALILFATILSLRVRKLRNAVDSSLLDDGTIIENMKTSSSNDEIGDLSRSFSRLITQLKDYTDYLRSLSGKLSHELRTPLAIVKSSLENMRHDDSSEGLRLYGERALGGVNRLQDILNSMNESTRLEQGIDEHEKIDFDLCEMLKMATQAYGDINTQHNFQFINNLESAAFNGVPELLMQMLDKLVANAVDFCPEGGNISIGLSRGESSYKVLIANDGPLLPETMQEKLFDSLVSLRQGKSDKAHLGLGLYIVRLIVEFHDGQVKACNRPDNSGVEFKVTLPCPPFAGELF